MERSIRIGKDFNVLWSIRKVVDGERQPYELAGKELVLQYRRPNGTLHEAKGWRVDGNIIIWPFRGRDQKAPGLYGLILTENGGKDGMVTVDTCRAFNLVEHSCEETEGSGSDIVIEDVVLESEVAFAPIVIENGGGSYDDTEIKDKLAELSEENERLKERIEEQDQFIEDLQNTKIDREADDYYPKLAVGLADNLAGVDVVDSEINFRRSGGGAISDGVARIESIKGNSVVWNQIFSGGFVGNKASVENVDNGAVITAEAATFINAYIPFNFIPNHKYLYSTIATLPYADTVVIGTDTNGNAQYRQIVSGANTPTAIEGIVSCVSPAATFYIFPNWNVAASVGDSFKFEDIRIVDLTKMFGSGNEPATIAEFYQRIPLGVDLNAYNEGEVIHMDVQSIESVGVNQWDEEWEQGGIASASGLPITLAGAIRSKNFSPIFPSTSYYVNWAAYTGDKYIFFYDREQNFISKSSFASNGAVNTPSNAAYFKIRIDQGSSFHKDICINLSDTSINGKYYPYIKRVEDLAVIRKYFPQGMKSAGSAHDAIRYNKESGKWEKVVATGIRAYQEGDADNAAYLTDGKVTCYPLAEPIVTELDEVDQFKDLDYQVWNCGTEKAIAEGKSSALAAGITYGFNAIGKIKELESLVAALRAKVGI